jgi:hypothetical protein
MLEDIMDINIRTIFLTYTKGDTELSKSYEKMYKRQ